MEISQMMATVVNAIRNEESANNSWIIFVNPNEIEYVKEMLLSEELGHIIPMLVPQENVEEGKAIMTKTGGDIL